MSEMENVTVEWNERRRITSNGTEQWDEERQEWVPEPNQITLTVTRRTVPRRRTADDWWEHLERNPETGVETWVRIRPFSTVEIAMGIGADGEPF